MAPSWVMSAFVSGIVAMYIVYYTFIITLKDVDRYD
jgi:hypothetical protein